MMKKSYILLLFLVVQFTVNAQTIRRVSTDGINTNTGNSWSTTMSIHAALSASQQGDEIWVKAGTYTPNQLVPATETDDIYKTFYVKPGVKVYGGFSGSELNLAERNSNDPTIFSGEVSATKRSLHVIYAATSNQSNALSAENKIILDNIHIAKGKSNSSNISSHSVQGAAIHYSTTTLLGKIHVEINNVKIYDCEANLGSIYVPDGSILTVKNSAFYNNKTVGGVGSSTINGTCIHAVDNSTVNIDNCTFRDNKQSNTILEQGGAIYAKGEYGKFVTLNINNVEFSNNESKKAGGAIRLLNQVNLTITNSSFKNNKVLPTGASGYDFSDEGSNAIINSGGGAILFTCSNNPAETTGSIKIINSRFEGNTSTTRGGALLITGINNSNSFIKNSYFINNNAEISGAALDYRQSNKNAGLAAHNQDLIISNNIFYNNTVKYYGAAISVIAACPIILANNTFYKNAITENTVTAASYPVRQIGGGAAVHFTSAGAYNGSDLRRVIANCLFVDNTAPNASAYQNIVPGTTSATGSYTKNSIFIGGNGFTNDTDGSVITSGYTATDIFKSTTLNSSHFLRLLPNNSISNNVNPAINTGLNPITRISPTGSLTFTTDSLDLANNSRVLANLIDMGAYEAHPLAPEVLPVDFVSLVVQNIKSGAQLIWKVASENNNEKFVIERGIDGVNFETIGYKNSLGNTANTTTYSYTDNKPLNGTSYYRLSQVDLDGTKKVLAVKPFNFSLNTNEVHIYPVPAKNSLTVKVMQPQSDFIALELISISGRKVLSQSFSKQIAMQGGAQLNLTSLVNGVYILIISNGSSVEKRTITVSK